MIQNKLSLTYSSNHHINRPFPSPVLATLSMLRNAGGDPLFPGEGGARTGLVCLRVAPMPRFQSEAKCEAFDMKMIFLFSCK